MKRVLVFFLCLSGVPGFAQAPEPAAASAPAARNGKWAMPLTLEGVPNLHRLTDYLYRSEQPTAEGFRNLEKLGITLRFRPVDFALYQQRLRSFDYDIISLAFQGTHNPGQEFADLRRFRQPTA